MVRIIPRLDIKGPNLVKGMHLEGLRVLGQPDQFARFYYEQGADELLYMDAVASLYQRNSLLDLVERTSAEVHVPLTVGGGLRTIEDIRAVLRAGADKVAINTAAIRRPEFITEASRIFGSSTIVVGIEAIRQPDGSYQAFTDCGREHTGRDAIRWAHEVEQLGAGELLVTSVDREGTGKGYDLELIQKIASSVSIPVIASGGAGKVADVVKVIQEGCADAVSVASILHYDFIQKFPTASDHSEGNTEFLKRKTGFLRVQASSLDDIKTAMMAAGIACRNTLKSLQVA